MFAHFSGRSFGFSVFSTHAHTHALATGCYLACGLSKSVCVNTRKNREICLRRAQRQGKSWWSIGTDGQIVRCAWREKRKTQWNHLVAGSLRSFPHFQEKRMIRGIGRVLFWTFSHTVNGEDHMVTLGELLEQVIALCGPLLVSRKLAMRHEPSIGLRCCSRWSKNHCFSDENAQVLSTETLFHRIGAPLLKCSYSVKQCFKNQLLESVKQSFQVTEK